MVKAVKIKELQVTTQNKVGALAQVSSAIAESGANITAICAYGMGGSANFMIVTDNNAKALAALKKKGYQAKEKDAVKLELENKVGTLSEISGQFAKNNIDLSYIYGTVAESGTSASIILSSNNDDKVIGTTR
jgi:hypothetical protein